MKVRRLAFDSKDDAQRRKAALLFQGFLIGGNHANESRPKGPDATRREAKVLRKFRRIGTKSGDDNSISFTLFEKDEPLVLELDVPEFEMLSKYFWATPWSTHLSEEIEEIGDYLSTLPIEESDA